ncbi:hypothetical protein GE061_012488 [Apolygus lucorum]|uniref:NADP-dependent oxidoreductase domain-containing protein n=1 Tax=Apolygus lucorum TaxID=248454 RepID=A0A8S9XUJ0_APOLU|nr:hypothetical protein GE061_012488 [Apolygus lucorum]
MMYSTCWRLVSVNTTRSTSRLYHYGNNPTIKLNTGCPIPVLGLGTWKSKPGEVLEAVKYAICVGYRHIDCALLYGNEKEVGQAIQAKICDGTITRENIFVTSKLWNTFHGNFCKVKEGLEKTLTDLCLPYLDLYLIHWPTGFVQGDELWPKSPNGEIAVSTEHHFTCVWQEMERLQKIGLTRMIGVSNFNQAQINKIMSIANICPVMNQVECHPYLNQVQLSSFCKEKTINITAYSPLGARDFVSAGTPGPLDDYMISCIAKKHCKTAGQILIRYQIQRGHVVIPKSVSPERIAQNFEVFDFSLSDQEMNMILALERGKKGRIIKFLEAAAHPEYPFTEQLEKSDPAKKKA